MHSQEFAALTKFCIEHFGSVRDLHSPVGGSSISMSSSDSNDNIERGRPSSAMFVNDPSLVASGLLPPRIASSQMSPSQSTSNWIPKSTQPRSLTKMLADAERKANMVQSYSQSQSKPQSKDGEAVKATTGNQQKGTAEQMIGRMDGVMEEHCQLTESILLSWIQDNSFMAEVLSF